MASSGLRFEELTGEDGPPALEGFAMCNDDKTLFVFGGVGLDGQETNDLHKFTLENGWEKIECDGEKPTGRVAASLACLGDNIYLFGGCSTEGNGWMNDFFIFDIPTKSWTEWTKEGLRPSKRDKTTLTAVPSRNVLLLYGGFGPQEREPEPETGEEEVVEESSRGEESGSGDEVQVLKVVRGKQKAQSFEYHGDFFTFHIESGEWEEMEIGEEESGAPPGLAAHSAVQIAGHLVVFGGKDEEGIRSDKLYVYNIEASKWTLGAEGEGERPCGRSYHGCCPVGDAAALVFGGRDNDDFELDDFNLLAYQNGHWKWVEPSINDDPKESHPPSGRFGHALCILKDKTGKGRLVVYGGLAELDPDSGVADTVLKDMILGYENELLSLLQKEDKEDGPSPPKKARLSNAAPLPS